MAYPCRLWMKPECDGCGMCDERYELGQYKKPRYTSMPFDEENYNPFEDCEEDY